MFAAHFGQDLNTHALGEFVERRCCEKCANKPCATLRIYVYIYTYIIYTYIRAYARTYNIVRESRKSKDYHRCDPLTERRGGGKLGTERKWKTLLSAVVRMVRG